MTREELVARSTTHSYYKETTPNTRACMDRIDEAVNHEQERGMLKDEAFD